MTIIMPTESANAAVPEAIAPISKDASIMAPVFVS